MMGARGSPSAERMWLNSMSNSPPSRFASCSHALCRRSRSRPLTPSIRRALMMALRSSGRPRLFNTAKVRCARSTSPDASPRFRIQGDEGGDAFECRHVAVAQQLDEMVAYVEQQCLESAIPALAVGGPISVAPGVWTDAAMVPCIASICRRKRSGSPSGRHRMMDRDRQVRPDRSRARGRAEHRRARSASRGAVGRR